MLPMRTQRREQISGFSLIELMVVISIIIVLAGITAAAMPGIRATINRKNTTAFLAEITSGLEKYQIDNGIFPQVPEAGSRSERGLNGSEILYQHLSGDFNLDPEGKADAVEGIGDGPEEKIYVQKLDYWSNRKSDRKRSYSPSGSGPPFYVIDTFNSPVRYIADPPNLLPPSSKQNGKKRTTFNPTYDLWSTVGADADSEDSAVQSRFITNWQSN